VLKAGAPHRRHTDPVGRDAEGLSSADPGDEVGEAETKRLAVGGWGDRRRRPRPSVVMGDDRSHELVRPSERYVDAGHVSGADRFDESVVGSRPRDEGHRSGIPVDLTCAGLRRVGGQIDAQGSHEGGSM